MNLKSIISKFIPEKSKQLFRDRQKKEKWKKIVHAGYDTFLKTGITSHESYIAMIELYCATNGKYNEEFHEKIAKINPMIRALSTEDEIFGKLENLDYKGFNKTLNDCGYVSFSHKLSSGACRELFDFALRTPADVKGYDEKIVFDPLKPVSEIYRLHMTDVINCDVVQSLVMNPALINIARNYLQCEPIFDFPAMWWTTNYNTEASSEAAQLYHFDMDRIKWLKIFFYINDVTPENGPHCYIKGSHKIGAKPAKVLQKGYSRIEDSELQQYYNKEDFIELCAPSGSIFAGDTKCWHKGKPLKKGNRLVLEFEYTASMFGANYPKNVVKKTTPEFIDFCKKNKRYASNLHFE